MDCILFYVYRPLELTGSTINAVEYYLAIYEHNPSIKLMLLNCDEYWRNEILKIIRDRYNLEDLVNWENNIICSDLFSIIKQEFDRVLVIDFSTIKKTRPVLKAKKLIVLQEKYTHLRPYTYDSLNSNDIIRYGEMPWQETDYWYRMKMLFSRFKKLRFVEKRVYINSPRNNDLSFVKELKLKLGGRPIIYKKRKHMNNLFEHFDMYVYYHADTWFDPHPRLFVECAYYDKKIKYINKFNIKDGSYYRYWDVRAKGIENRTLSKDDEIVREFL
jgi:hypothetical protein